MKRSSTFFLRIAVICIGIPILAVCIFVLPKIVNEAFGQAKDGADIAYVILGILIIMYIATIPFYLALYQSLKLLSYIDNNLAFSEVSVKSLKMIRNFAAVISGLYVLSLPLLYIVAEWDDAPGLILIGIVIIGASLAIAIFAAVLKKLLQEAIRIKSENDLTV